MDFVHREKVYIEATALNPQRKISPFQWTREGGAGQSKYYLFLVFLVTRGCEIRYDVDSNKLCTVSPGAPPAPVRLPGQKFFQEKFSPFQWTGRWEFATFLYALKCLKNSANRK
jgi:hypothetical protein